MSLVSHISPHVSCISLVSLISLTNLSCLLSLSSHVSLFCVQQVENAQAALEGLGLGDAVVAKEAAEREVGDAAAAADDVAAAASEQ